MTRRRRQRKVRIPLWVHGAMFIALALVLWTILPKPRSARSFAQPQVSPYGEPLPVRSAAAVRGKGRPVYRHSVIAGGAYSVAEVERARRGDPVVSAHYAVFDVARLRMTEAPAPKSVYVSYRIGSRVYWTRNRVRLAAREALITDGEHMARARCGNRVADTPQQPVGADEPPAADLDVEELPVPPESDSRLASALVVDLFPPEPLSQMAQSWSATVAAPFSQSSSMAGVGSVGTRPGAVARAETGSGPTVPPVNGAINSPPGSEPLLPGPWPTRPAPGWELSLPVATAAAPSLPNRWLPSTGPNEYFEPTYFAPTVAAGQNPIASAWGTIPLPGTSSSGRPPALPGPASVVGDSLKTGETPGVVLPQPIPVFPLPDPSVDPVPEPGTATLLILGMALAVISETRRRH